MKKLMSIMLVVVVATLFVSCGESGDDAAQRYVEYNNRTLNLPCEMGEYYVDLVKIEGKDIVFTYTYQDDRFGYKSFKDFSHDVKARMSDGVLTAYALGAAKEERELVVALAKAGYGFKYNYHYKDKQVNVSFTPEELLKAFDSSVFDNLEI